MFDILMSEIQTCLFFKLICSQNNFRFSETQGDWNPNCLETKQLLSHGLKQRTFAQRLGARVRIHLILKKFSTLTSISNHKWVCGSVMKPNVKTKNDEECSTWIQRKPKVVKRDKDCLMSMLKLQSIEVIHKKRPSKDGPH